MGQIAIIELCHVDTFCGTAGKIWKNGKKLR